MDSDNKKITQLTVSVPVATDIMPYVSSPGTSPVTKKTLYDNGGWIGGIGTWSYSSADAPTFVITINADMTALIGVGYRIKLTQTTAKYFIVTAVGAFSGGNTLITVYGGTDYTLENAAITLPYYSNVKSPFGFPISPAKWSVIVSNTSDITQATPTQNVWYNPGSVTINVPIGEWKLSYNLVLYFFSTASQTSTNGFVTLGTANNNSYAPMASAFNISGASGTLGLMSQVTKISPITLTTKQTYYLNVRTTFTNVANIIIYGAGVGTTVILAECAYL